MREHLDEQERSKRHAERCKRMRQEQIRQRKQRKKMKRYGPIVLAACVIFIILTTTIVHTTAQESSETATIETTTITEEATETELTGVQEETTESETTDVQGETAESETVEVQEETTESETADVQEETLGVTDHSDYEAQETATTKAISDDVVSQYAILVDTQSGEIIAQRNAQTEVSPASMTKILTVLVAAEHITESDLDDMVEITSDVTDFCYQNDCSAVGFEPGDQVSVRDLFYGTILCSGADAAMTLANYVAGSQDAFVEMMNEKLQQLGLSDTAHFTNCIGIYDKDHYCSVYDMAMILEAAVHNDFCKEVMSEHKYNVSVKGNTDGINISNWFLRRIEDKDTGGTVVCAKTGYVAQSGNCAASYAEGNDGEKYICVTADSTSAWRCIYDHVAIYDSYL